MRWIFNYLMKWVIKPLFIQYDTSKQITYKKTAIPKAMRNSVWEKYHGNSEKGKCYCCNCKVEKLRCGWHCSHVKSDRKGGQTNLDNLRVCCPGCNLAMGDQNLYAYIRDKKLNGPGKKNMEQYFKKYPSERYDKRTNNRNNK